MHIFLFPSFLLLLLLLLALSHPLSALTVPIPISSQAPNDTDIHPPRTPSIPPNFHTYFTPHPPPRLPLRSTIVAALTTLATFATRPYDEELVSGFTYSHDIYLSISPSNDPRLRGEFVAKVAMWGVVGCAWEVGAGAGAALGAMAGSCGFGFEDEGEGHRREEIGTVLFAKERPRAGIGAEGDDGSCDGVADGGGLAGANLTARSNTTITTTINSSGSASDICAHAGRITASITPIGRPNEFAVGITLMEALLVLAAQQPRFTHLDTNQKWEYVCVGQEYAVSLAARATVEYWMLAEGLAEIASAGAWGPSAISVYLTTWKEGIAEKKLVLGGIIERRVWGSNG
ncbi:uncharacterized protein KY384_003909 [Bacidia gigantensis]|uniref:uncharacterized protein n=1 Tax=Bacidia gigantensis TaxID=2732470 RepID=UPI001D05981C|nr:uncharacterized protein KY384_003909 [Bacidia gigantensis]KAG8532268.1 hypothetical protein KY384_003909 [Bacidia gigantensis]